MISLDDIKNITFRRASFGGYKPYEVDSFIDNIQISFSELYEQNIELKGYIKELEHKLEKYQEEESCIRNAILSAQKLADASLLDADNRSKGMILDASKQANEIVCKAKKESELERNASWKLHMQAEKFRSKLIKLYDDQVDVVKRSLDGIEGDEQDPALFEKIISDESIDANKFDEQPNNYTQNKEDQGDPTVIDISSHDKEDVGFYRDESELNEELKKANDTVVSGDRKKLENLKFGSNYSFSSCEFGKGLYSGLFRCEK